MTTPFGYRGPDGEIDLERALGPHLTHYVGVMVAGANGSIRQVIALGGGVTAHGMLLRQAFGRPTRASSCGTLAVIPGWSWDVCGYYRALGVQWTATKGQIRRAYLRACQRGSGFGQDERLTYVVAQLSDARIRRAYDMVPLGGLFTWDRDTEARLKRAAATEAARRRTAEGTVVTADEILDEMGLREPPADPDGDVPQRARQRPGRPPAARWAAQWGHYLLAGPQGPPLPDDALLEAWQGMVAAALRERGIVMAFAVAQGVTGSPGALRDINESCIFVVTDEGASPGKAAEAVEMGISLGIVEITSDHGRK